MAPHLSEEGGDKQLESTADLLRSFTENTEHVLRTSAKG